MNQLTQSRLRFRSWLRSAVLLAFAVLVVAAPLLAQGPGAPTSVNIVARAATPVITNVSPSSGVAGATVTITGTGFNVAQGSGTVTFNGVSATVILWSSTSIAVTVPSATTGAVIVSQNGQSANGGTFTVNSSCDQTLSSGASITSALSTAPSGSSICLNAGSYPAVNATVTKTSYVTVRAAPGVSASSVVVNGVNVNNSQFVNFTGVTIGSGSSQIGTFSLNAHHIVFDSIVFTGSLCVLVPQDTGSTDTTITHGSFINVGQSCQEGRLSVYGVNVSKTTDNGVTISYTLFQGTTGSGQSDGIQLVGDARGTQIGPGNIFRDILEGTCGAVHCDAIQFYGASRTNIFNNFFYNNSDSIVSWGCNGSPMTISGNTFYQEPGSAANNVALTGSTGGDVIDHNTFGIGSNLAFENPNACGGTPVNETVTNNILLDGIDLNNGASSATFTMHHNNGIVTGTSNCVGTIVFVGGSSSMTSSTWTNWALSASSACLTASSTGGVLGATYFGP